MIDTQTPKKLHRQHDDRVIAGVCGGLGNYFNIDPVIFRILFILLIFSHGIGLLIYLLLWVIVPEEVETKLKNNKNNLNKNNKKNGDNKKYILGTFLVLIGIGALIFKFLSISLSFEFIWPIIFIFVGWYLIFK